MNKKCFMPILTMLIVLNLGFVSGASYKVGDSGEDIKFIQKKLVKNGIRVEIDGEFGKDTEIAVRIFQKKKHLKVDGIIGEETYYALTGKHMKSVKKIKKEKRKIFKEKRSIYGIDDRHVRWDEPGILKGKVKNLTDEAKRYIGVPYRFGGITPEGFDCSGFIKYVFDRIGVDLPRSADEQFEKGNKINLNSLKPGDLVFFNTYDEGVSHSGIYMGSGDFISATTSQGIAIASMKSGYWHDRYIGASRVI